jgi:tetratricopeptide (TPR) repeat protein
MLPRNGFVGALVTAAAVLAGSTTAQAHGHGGGGHGGFHGGGFHGGFHGYGGYGYGGFGYAPFGVGLGLGVGYGLGYGLGYGAFGYGYPYGYGYGYGYPYAFGGYGYPYRGFGYPYGYGYPYVGYSGYGYGVPYAANAGAAYPYSYSASYATTPPAVTSPTVTPPIVMSPAVTPAPPAPGISTRSAITAARRRPARTDFVKQGDDAFKTGAYAAAAQAWQHALIDDPHNGTLALKAAQAMFAAGQYEKAADTVQRGFATLPASRWGGVVRDRSQLYGAKAGDYASQLQALERAVRDQPENTDEQFLLAYQYAFSSRTSDATRILDDVLQVAPENTVAKSLRDTLQPSFAPPAPQPPSVPTTVSRKPMSRTPSKSIDL